MSVLSEPNNQCATVLALASLSATVRHTRTTPSTVQALLVGALGERYITCVDGGALGFSKLGVSPFEREGIIWPAVILSGAIASFIAFSVTLLSSEAAQAMAVWMFNGTDCRSVAAICLVLCVSIPFALLAWRNHAMATILRLIEQCPPATDMQR